MDISEEIDKILPNSTVTSVTFGGLYFVLEGLGVPVSDSQRRWRFRSSSRVDIRQNFNQGRKVNFAEADQRCLELVSLIDGVISSIIVDEYGAKLVFSSGAELIFERDPQSNEIGDLECYLVDKDFRENLEGLWAI